MSNLRQFFAKELAEELELAAKVYEQRIEALEHEIFRLSTIQNLLDETRRRETIKDQEIYALKGKLGKSNATAKHLYTTRIVETSTIASPNQYDSDAFQAAYLNVFSNQEKNDNCRL